MNSIKIFILVCFCLGLSGLCQAQEDNVPLRLTLHDALQRASTVNLQVMMASARIEQAIARLSEARSSLLPHIDGQVSGARQTTDLRYEGLSFPIPNFPSRIGPYNNFDARPSLTIALFDPGAFDRFQAAKKGKKFSEVNLEKTKEDVLALVASLFTDAERKTQTVGLLKTILDKDQMAYNLSETNFSQGTGTVLDVNKLKSNLDETQYLYQQAQTQALDARLDLAAALQLPLDQSLELVEDNNFLKVLKNGTGHNGPDHNADVLLAASNLEQSRANEKTAWAGFLPTISGTADYGRLGESPSRGSDTYFVGLQVSIPLWDGGSQEAQLAEARADLKEAQENLKDTHNQAQVNIDSALAAIVEADDLALASSDEEQTAQESLMITQHAQEIGSGSSFDVMQAKSDLAQAQDAYNEAKAAWVMSYINLLHAQGRLRDLVNR